jgi:hypothetical protein
VNINCPNLKAHLFWIWKDQGQLTHRYLNLSCGFTRSKTLQIIKVIKPVSVIKYFFLLKDTRCCCNDKSRIVDESSTNVVIIQGNLIILFISLYKIILKNLYFTETMKGYFSASTTLFVTPLNPLEIRPTSSLINVASSSLMLKWVNILSSNEVKKKYLVQL